LVHEAYVRLLFVDPAAPKASTAAAGMAVCPVIARRGADDCNCVEELENGECIPFAPILDIPAPRDGKFVKCGGAVAVCKPAD
jgi:hypothetical protein